METRNTTRLAARQAIADLAAATDPLAFVQHYQHDAPSIGGGQLEQPHPLAALRSAAQLQLAMREEVASAALLARSAGESWSSVADALGLVDGDRADAEAAYLSTLGVRAAVSGAPLGVLWTCSSCRCVVRDIGPELADPAQREAGHGGDCPRHVRDIILWRTEVQQ